MGETIQYCTHNYDVAGSLVGPMADHLHRGSVQCTKCGGDALRVGHRETEPGGPATGLGYFGMLLDFSPRVYHNESALVSLRVPPWPSTMFHKDARTRRARADTAASSPYKLLSSPLGIPPPPLS